jgi:hypothetical protein
MEREVIRDRAALLTAFQQREIEAIQRSGITHAPTMGAQYEGITSSILEMMIPSELQLQVVSGFVEGVERFAEWMARAERWNKSASVGD